MDSEQKRNFWIIAIIGVVYFLAFCFPNARGAADETMLGNLSHDEAITYPYVVHMLTPGKDIHETWWRLIIYGDYHYGYPFYFYSMLVLLPVRLIYGLNFTAHTQLNLLLLRQLVSVLPIIITAGLLVFLMTRFRGWLRSVGLFIFILAIPSVVSQNLNWWHPDAMTLLAIVLTIFFLERDRLRLGKYFYIAAVTCGVAIATKLLGFFFFITIPAYLIAGLVKKTINIKKAALGALGFVLLMSVTILVSNPFLFYQTQRVKMVTIQTEKSQELSVGYFHDDRTYYQKGPKWWKWTLENWYAPEWYLYFLGFSLLAGCLVGSRKFLHRLMLTWIVPYSTYLLFFIAPKPDSYWLPAMLPLFSGSLSLLSTYNPLKYTPLQKRPAWKYVSWGIFIGVLALVIYVFIWNMQGNVINYLRFLNQ
jgi:hypothetical protein